jgi:hypothetical protein
LHQYVPPFSPRPHNSRRGDAFQPGGSPEIILSSGLPRKEPNASPQLRNGMSLLGDLWVRAMREGNYELAWAVSERACAERDPRTRDDPSQPYHTRWVWDGRSFAGKDVLVRCYHGLGDSIQYARYLPLLARHARTVTVEVNPRLLPVLGALRRDVRLVPFDPNDPLPPSECDLEIMDLAFALRSRPGDRPPPYLEATPAILPKGTIGICWEAGDWDITRCVPEGLMGPLCNHRPTLSLVPGPTRLPVLNPTGCPFDLPTTASLIASCELVITVDTMIAHLAGALGKPVWMLLKHEPDWRWSTAGGRSDWYPSARLYIQPHPGSWGAAIAQLGRDLAAIGSAGHRGTGR